ncbi:MAG: phosphate ABC transporter ATP-binding protein [Planctomycetota bacterium]|jgi:phosphate transport system ATP-binding protein
MSVSPADVDAPPLFTVTGLSVAYGRVSALRDVNLTVRRQRVTAIVGPSGCGKSTFLSVLNRLTDLIPGCHVSGRVLLEEEDVLAPTCNLFHLRRRVGMVFQKPNPFPLSLCRNLTLPLKEHHVLPADIDSIVERSLRDVGLWDEVKDRLDQSALKLSGGQQQRLCLARALSLQPEVLLCDEPCSALDPLSGAVVEDLIGRLRERLTVVIVTHNLAQARRIADDVAVFWQQNGAGTVIESGSVADVFENPRSEITAAYVAGMRG